YYPWMADTQLLQLFLDVLNCCPPAVSSSIAPPMLWHYTTAAGVECILSQRYLRATNFSFLNDPSELQYGRGLVVDMVRGARDASRGMPRRFFSRVLHLFELEASEEIYVVSFTEREDDLSQWRAYGTG